MRIWVCWLISRWVFLGWIYVLLGVFDSGFGVVGLKRRDSWFGFVLKRSAWFCWFGYFL